MPLVSVCIPTYQRARYIGETIQSVLNSTFSDFEIVVSDNASTDHTQEIVESFGDKRIRFYCNERNVGPVRNWNLALQRASGELVGVLFSDDLYGPFWLSFAVRALQKYPQAGWVSAAFHIVDKDGQVTAAISRFPETRMYSRVEAFPVMATLAGLGPV